MNALLILFSFFNTSPCNGVDTVDIISCNVVLTKVIEVYGNRGFLENKTSIVIYIDSSNYHSDRQITRKIGEYNFTFKKFNGVLKKGDFFVSYYNTPFDGLRCQYKSQGASDLTQIISIHCSNGEIDAQTIEITESTE